MTATRSRKEEVGYKRSLRSTDKTECPFCKENDSSLIEDGKSFRVIRNIFPYSLWDGQDVEDHLMITPKKHTNSLAGLSSKEKAEYVDLISKYEALGYNLYARAPKSKIKSVVHQHTHLIKNIGETRRFVFLLRKPYIRVVLK